MRVNTIVLHHSASFSGSVEVFRREHKRRGFTDIGYHWVIGNGHGMADGACQTGRPQDQKGAGVYGNNEGKWHICLVGNFHGDTGKSGPTKAQLQKLSELLGDLVFICDKEKWGKPALVGHKEITLAGHGTACPGDHFPLGLIKQWFREQVSPGGITKVELDDWLVLQHSPIAKDLLVPAVVPPSVTVLVKEAFDESPSKVFGLPYVLQTVPYSSEPPQAFVPLRRLCHGLGWHLRELPGDNLELTTAYPKPPVKGDPQ